MSRTLVQAVFFDLGDTLVADRQWLPGAREAMDLLRQSGLRIGLLSNTGQLDRPALLGYLPAGFSFGLFDGPLVVLSSEVRLEKPAAEIFDLAVSRSGSAGQAVPLLQRKPRGGLRRPDRRPARPPAPTERRDGRLTNDIGRAAERSSDSPRLSDQGEHEHDNG